MQGLIDSIPIFGVFLVIIVASLLIYELGYKAGRWWQQRQPGEQEGPGGILIGSLLTLLAFLLAVTMGMASERFDNRRSLVLQEANTIGTTFLRAGYLPAPANDEMRELLREYASLRVAPSNTTQLEANIARSEELHDEMWAIAEDVARTQGNDVIALFIESLNETIDLHESRVIAGIHARVPQTVIWLLAAGALLSVGMLGYGAGITGHRSVLSAAVLVVALATVLTLVIDLDRPRDGLIQVSQQPLIDLQNELGPPSQ